MTTSLPSDLSQPPPGMRAITLFADACVAGSPTTRSENRTRYPAAQNGSLDGIDSTGIAGSGCCAETWTHTMAAHDASANVRMKLKRRTKLTSLGLVGDPQLPLPARG